MSFTYANWTCLSASLNQGQRTVTPFGGSTTILNSPNLFMYGSPNDTITEITSTGYFNPVITDLSIGDWILGNGTDGSFLLFVQNIDNGTVTIGFVNTTPPSSQYLLKSQNLADVVSTETSFANLGFGSGQLLILNDLSFTGGVYTLTNPCPNYIVIICNTTGNKIRLPSAQGLGSFSLSEGPYIQVPFGFQSIEVDYNDGTNFETLNPPSMVNFTLSAKSTVNGQWLAVPRVLLMNSLSGNVDIISSDDSVNIDTSTGQIDLTVSGSGSSPPTIIYVSNSGSDVNGNGTIDKPYATLSHSLASITPSSSTPFLILMQGIFTETNLALKPWCAIIGQDSASLTVTGSVTLDASWSTGGELTLNHFYQLAFPATVTLDFNVVASGPALFTFANNLQTGSTALTITGHNTNGAVFLYSNNINFNGSWDITLNNCYGALQGGDTGNVTVNHSSATAGGNFNLVQLTIEGNLLLNDTTASAGMTLFVEECKVIGTTTYASNGSSTIEVFSNGNNYFNTPTIDNGTGGGLVQFFADFLTNLPALANGAGFNPSTIADAIAANNYFNPSAYTPVAGPPGEWVADSVVGNLAGIDAALNAITTGNNIPQLVYADSVTGNDGTADGSPAKPFLTYAAASAFAAASAVVNNPYTVKLIGNFSEAGMLLYPFVNIDGQDNAIFTTGGNVTLDTSWNSVSNPYCRVQGFILNANQVDLTFTTYQGAALEFYVNWGITPDIQVHGSATTGPEKVAFYGRLSYSGTPLEIEVYDVQSYFENMSAEGSIVINNNNAVYASETTVKNCQGISTIFNSTSNTQDSYLFVFGSPQISNITLQDNKSYVTIDSTSYTSQITLAGTSTTANINIRSLSDGVNCSTYTPINFSPIAIPGVYGNTNLTSYIAGIDSKLAGSGTPIAQNVYINSVNGLDSITRDGSIDSPWASYNYALSQVGSSATSTNQILINIIGQQSTSNFDIVPWVHVDGHNSGTITCSGSVINDLLWQSTNNAITYVRNCTFVAPAGLSALWGGATGNLLIYEGCDMTQVDNVFSSANNTNGTFNTLVIKNCQNPALGISSFPSGITLNDTFLQIEDAFTANITANATGSGGAGAQVNIVGCNVGGLVTIDSSTGTGGFALGQFFFSNIQIGPVISGVNSQIILDTASYTFPPNLTNGAIVGNIDPTGLTDSSLLTSFTPTNFNFVAGNWAFNSLTGYLEGIDNALATAGATLQAVYNNGTPGALGNIVLLNSANPLFIINNDGGTDQTTIVSYNGTATPSFRWGFTAQGLNTAPTAINYAKFLAHVTSSTAGAEFSDIELDAYQNGTELTVAKISGTDGSLTLPVVGGKLKYPNTAGGAIGTATLVAGIVVVNTGAIAVGDHVSVTNVAVSGTAGILTVPNASIVPGVSFSIVSTDGGDNSTVTWAIIGAA
jgi:hypothetical protein